MTSLTIPEKCGVILLPSTVLFPHGAMPLHIFEPRYRKMLDEALEGNCLFCVGNLLRNETPDLAQAVAKVGTVGLIRASRESKKGTSNLLLHGVFRVSFDQWLDEKPYPYATISPVLNTTLTSYEEKDYIPRLRQSVNRALEKFPKAVTERINHTLDQADDPTTIADAISQQFIHDPADRQKLLETGEVRKRLDFLIRFLDHAGS